jgi:hypothetical protein
MILDILQVIAGIAGLIGIVAAVFLGYRSSQSAVPILNLKLGAFDDQTRAYIAILDIHNPGRQPIIVRALAIQRPRGAAFLAAVEQVQADGTRTVGPQPTDMVSLDSEIDGQASREFDLYISFGEGGKPRRVQVEVEYIDKRAPTQVLALRVESQADPAG